MTYHKGDKVYVELSWTLGEDFRESEFIYPLGDLVVDKQKHNGDIYNGTTRVGEYWTDDDNVLHIKLTDDDYVQNATNRSVSVNLEGSFQINETDLANGDSGEFHIGDKTLTLVAEYDESSVSLNKSSSSPVTLNDEGKFEVEYTLDININGTISNLCIKDIFEKGLYLPEDGYEENFSFTFTPAHQGLDGQAEEENNACNPDIVYTEDENKFTLTFNGQFHDGDKISVKYIAYVTPDQMREMFNGSKVKNTAQGTYTSNKGPEPKDITPSEASSVSVEPPTLSKTGRWVDEDEGVEGFTTIEWTITFYPGSTYSNLENFIKNDAVWDEYYPFLDPHERWRAFMLSSDLREALGVELGLSAFEDSLGNGHHLLSEDGQYLNLKNLTLADFKWDSNNNCYVLTYKTEVHEAQTEYTNKVKTTVFDKELSGEAAVGIGYELDKEFVGKNEDGTMSWNVDLEVPYAALDSWVLTDIPEIPKKTGYNNTAQGWLHRVIPDSILVVELENGLPKGTPQSLEKIGATASYNSDNGSVVITFNVKNSFIADKLSKPDRSERMIRLTLNTEIVDSDTERIDEAFDESFYYKNTVNDTLTLTGIGNILRDDDADYQETVKPSINKGIVGGKKDWNTGQQLTSSSSTDIQWYVSISKNFLHWDKDKKSLTGIVADGVPFKLVLEDTLPEYMEYVEGSAYVTLSDYGANLSGNRGRPDNIDDFNALLTSGLTVTDNDNGTITMKWEMNDKLARDILDFTLKSEAGSEPLEARVGDGKRLNVASWGVSTSFWTNTQLEIYYNTRVTSYKDFVDNMKKPQDWSDNKGILFENTVDGRINGVPAGSDYASVMIYKEAELGKTLTDYNLEAYNQLRNDPDYRDYFRRYAVNANGIYNLFFHIDVNHQKFVFGTDDGMLHLTDQMKGLGLVLDSVMVTDVDTGKKLDRNEYIVSVDFKAKTVKFSVPDGRHFMIDYFTSIDANSIDKDGNIIGISNEVSLDGNYGEPISTTIGPMRVLRSSAIATSANTIQLYKYYTADSGNMSGLSGAKFRIKPLKLEGETLVDANRNDMDNIIDPGANGWWQYDETDGYFYMEGQSDPRVIFTNLHTDYIYYVWESQIPDGYTKGRDTQGKEIDGYYFVLNTYKGAEAGALYDLIGTVGSKYDIAVIASGDPQMIHNEQAPAAVTPEDSGDSGQSRKSDKSDVSGLSVVSTEVLHTGDDSMITLWLFTMGASAIGIVAASIRMRKRKKQ